MSNMFGWLALIVLVGELVAFSVLAVLVVLRVLSL